MAPLSVGSTAVKLTFAPDAHGHIVCSYRRGRERARHRTPTLRSWYQRGVSAPADYVPEPFTDEEIARLEPYVTNVDRPVFVLRNLPEVVKGAVFARYSRSGKSLRRLLLDEFLTDVASEAPTTRGRGPGANRGERLYERVFLEYGDDSVAQLGGVHVACEGASNILTKILEWGRLAAYLEQSTRYVPYTARPGGRWKYHVPSELNGSPLRDVYRAAMDLAFETYARWLPKMESFYRERFPSDGEPDRAYKASIRAKALDALRGLLPAATQSNVGIYATGQAYEAMLLRMRGADESEARSYAAMLLQELRKEIPAFMRRVDLPDRGEVWTRYLAECRQAARAEATKWVTEAPESADEVSLTDFEPDGETKVVAAALYAVSTLPDRQLLQTARRMGPEARAEVLRAYVGQRTNRRHKPGRAFERTRYRFDVLGDYGAFRDLQRHRMLTIEWQPLTPAHGFVMNEAVVDVGAGADWRRVMEASADAHDRLVAGGWPQVAPYAVAMAYRVRYYLDLNAREAMHLIELRSAPQGHAAYRRVAQAMHRLIRDEAGHVGIADAMTFVNHGSVDLERLEAERAADRRVAAAGETRTERGAD